MIPINSPYMAFYYSLLTYILSRTISKLLYKITGQIFPVDRGGYLFLTQNLAVRNQNHRSIAWREMYFDISDHLGVDHECDRQTDGQTEWPLAIERCNAVRRSLKMVLQSVKSVRLSNDPACELFGQRQEKEKHPGVMVTYISCIILVARFHLCYRPIGEKYHQMPSSND